jgi:hypothetical protein
MAKKKSGRKIFNFKWKLVENYAAAFAGLIFIWLFVDGVVNNNVTNLTVAIIILAIAPFLVTFLDKKSVR